MGIQTNRRARTRARTALAVCIALCASFTVGFATPAHADSDVVENHLCVNAGGFGTFGVANHTHITAIGGSYHISMFAQASAWTYTGSGAYCQANSATSPCQ